MSTLHRMVGFLRVDATAADRVVPPSAQTANLIVLTSAAMAFLAVFAMALSMASGRLADRWSESLARSATIRISAPADQMEAQTRAVLAVLATTPGIANFHALDNAQMKKLLDPWFGADLPVDALPLPRLIEVVENADGIDADGLRLRLSAEAPGAVFDDHTRWRQPLVSAANRLRLLGGLSLILIGGTMVGLITLAAKAALAANGQVIRTLRLIGARDSFIANAFERRFTMRGLIGSAVGTVAAMLGIALLPDVSATGTFMSGLGFTGWGWLWPLVVPPLAAVLSYWATRTAATRMLRGIR